MAGLDIETCSQTIRDAVTVARGLDIRYLCLDALCIVQDESTDKLQEIENMGMIYMDATVTIAAANSTSADYGFLETRPTLKGKQYLISGYENTNAPAMKTRIWQDHEPEHDHSKEPLSLRGWAFQEQILSQRLLQYGSKCLTWHCLDADKTVPVLHHYVRYKQRSKASRPAILQRAANFEGRVGFQLWIEMIEDYSNRELTFPGDRLLLVSGIARESHGFSRDTYLPGLWKDDLVRQLGWRQIEGNHAAESRTRWVVGFQAGLGWLLMAGLSLERGTMCLARYLQQPSTLLRWSWTVLRSPRVPPLHLGISRMVFSHSKQGFSKAHILLCFNQSP